MSQTLKLCERKIHVRNKAVKIYRKLNEIARTQPYDSINMEV